MTVMGARHTCGHERLMEGVSMDGPIQTAVADRQQPEASVDG